MELQSQCSTIDPLYANEDYNFDDEMPNNELQMDLEVMHDSHYVQSTNPIVDLEIPIVELRQLRSKFKLIGKF